MRVYYHVFDVSKLPLTDFVTAVKVEGRQKMEETGRVDSHRASPAA